MNTKIYKIMANARDAIGTHENTLTKRSKSGDLNAGTLVCFDTDAAYVKACSGEDLPWGVAKNDASGEESFVTIQPLTATSHTAQIRAASAIKAGDPICLAEDGGIQSLPSTTGAYKVVGIALTDGQAEERIEALTTLPYTLNVE